MLTVNPQQYTTYNLIAGDNPITFGAGTEIYAATGDGVFGAAETSWTVTNLGTLKAAGSGGDGIVLKGGGTVNNNTGGIITGVPIGIYITGEAGFLTNAKDGSISGENGVSLDEGGSVTNGGSITGTSGSGVQIAGAAGVVMNEAGGTIGGLYGWGVDLGDGGSVTNAGSIKVGPTSQFGQSGGIGVAIYGVAGSVTNQVGAYIVGNYGTGVTLSKGGSVTNAGQILGGTGVRISSANGVVSNEKGGYIKANRGWGVDLASGGSVTNFGRISGSAGSHEENANTYGGVRIIGAGVVTNFAGGSIIGEYGWGVTLYGGGTVSNAGAIRAYGVRSYGGVQILGATGLVTNQKGGSITGTTGVYFRAGGSVTNAGAIKGSTGVQVTGAAGVVINQTGGSISASYGWAVSLRAGGSVTNAGVIVSTQEGIGISNGGVEISGAVGVVTNKRGGSITAGNNGWGVYLAAGGSVTNAGSISGAIVFGGSGQNTLTLQSGSTLVGSAFGSVSGSNALILQGAGTANNTFESFNTLTVQTGGWWTLGGSSTFATANVAGGTLRIMGTYIESGGETTLGDASGQVGHLDIGSTGTYDITDHFGVALGTSSASSILNVGLFEKSGGILTSVVAADILNWGTISSTHNVLDLQGALTGTGALKVSQGATIEVDGFVGANLKLRFNASSAGEFLLNDLDVGGQQLFHGFITGWAAGDSVDVGTAFGAGTKAVFQENAALTEGVLSLTNGTAHASITFTGANSPADFVPTVDSLGATVFTY